MTARAAFDPRRIQDALITAITVPATLVENAVIDVERVQPTIYRGLKLALDSMITIGLVSLVIAAPIYFVDPLPLKIMLFVSLSMILAPLAFLGLWKSALSSGIEGELPALLSYLLPYSHTPRHIIDLLSEVPEGLFKWFRHEARRLRVLSKLDSDPLSVLKRLAETTPSKKLREVLIDYVVAHQLGAPRSQITLTLLNHAINAARAAWRSHMDLARGVVELTTASIVAMATMAPLSLLVGGEALVLAGLALLVPLLGSAFLLATRPQLGDYRPNKLVPAFIIASTLASALLAGTGSTKEALVIIGAAAIVSEIVWLRASRSEALVLRSLRYAAEEARFGKSFEKALDAASRVSGKVARAVIEAARIAGRIGVGDALSRLYRVVEESVFVRRQARGQALVLLTVTPLAVLIGAYAVKIVLTALSTATVYQVLAGSPLPAARPLVSVFSAMAVIAPLPGAILLRGWVPTLVPSLVTLAIVSSVL